MDKSDSKKNEILKVAQELFSKQGFEATTTREISKISEISDGSLYYYFPKGKKDILDTIVDTGTRRHKELLNQKFCKIQTLTQLSDELKNLESKISTFFADEDNYQTFLITVRERNIISDEQAKWLVGMIDENIANLVSGLKNIPEIKRFSNKEIESIAEILISIVQKSFYDELIVKNHRQIDLNIRSEVQERIDLFIFLLTKYDK